MIDSLPSSVVPTSDVTQNAPYALKWGYVFSVTGLYCFFHVMFTQIVIFLHLESGFLLSFFFYSFHLCYLIRIFRHCTLGEEDFDFFSLYKQEPFLGVTLRRFLFLGVSVYCGRSLLWHLVFCGLSFVQPALSRKNVGPCCRSLRSCLLIDNSTKIYHGYNECRFWSWDLSALYLSPDQRKNAFDHCSWTFKRLRPKHEWLWKNVFKRKSY